MKRCSKCNQYYADDLSFCLSDGTPLIGMLDDTAEQQTFVRPGAAVATEEHTVVRAPGSAAPVTASVKGGNAAIKIGAAVIGLLIFLFIVAGAMATFILWPRDNVSVTNTANKNANFNTNAIANSRATPISSPISNNVNTNTSDANVKNREDELERERRKLADERKKLEDEKRLRIKEDDEDDPPPIPSFRDSGPTRISFRRGSTGATVSGTVGRARSYVLRAMAGQYLGASVSSSGGCVIFSSGSSSTQFSVGSGDTYLYLKNTCRAPSNFSLSVTVR